MLQMKIRVRKFIKNAKYANQAMLEYVKSQYQRNLNLDGENKMTKIMD